MALPIKRGLTPSELASCPLLGSTLHRVSLLQISYIMLNVFHFLVIQPVKTHDDVVLYAIASRDVTTARRYARKHKFQRWYGSYEDLLADPLVDFVYISVPNSLHFEWAFKALEAGKHVLLEKPFTSTSIEASRLSAKAKECGKIIMEAFHWRFHPAAHRLRQLLDSGELGAITKIDASMTSNVRKRSRNIRWEYDLSGGSLMDMSYVVNFSRYFLHAELPEEVVHAMATTSRSDPRIDVDMLASLRFKRPGEDNTDVYSTVYSSLVTTYKHRFIPRFWDLPSITIETEKGVFFFYNVTRPHLYHYIGIKDNSTGKWRYEKVYAGGPLWKDRGNKHWSTYRYQLEAFVDKLRGRDPVCWVDNEDSVAQMKTIDDIYIKSGLPVRPTNSLATDI